MKSNKVLSVVLVAFALGLAKFAEAGEPTYADGVWTVPSDDTEAFTNAFSRVKNGERIELEPGVYDFTGIRSSADTTPSCLYYSSQNSRIDIVGKGATRGDVLVKVGATSSSKCRWLRVNKGGVCITNITFTGSYGDGNGAVLWLNGDCIISDCAFTNNIGKTSGAAYGGKFYNCLFKGNSCSGTGGALYSSSTSNCTFIANKAANSNGGGACYQGTHFDDTYVSNSLSYYGSCGEGVAGGTCVGCTFNGAANNTTGGGAAAYQCKLTNCTFTTGGLSGGTRAFRDCSAVEGCFITNYVSDYVLAMDSSINRCVFKDNRITASKINMVQGSTAFNSLFCGNVMSYDQSTVSYNSKFYNCTVTSNTFAKIAYSVLRGGSAAVNSIVARNTPYDIHMNDVPYFTNCVTTGFNTGTSYPSTCKDCVCVTPGASAHLFADYDGLDYHLRPGSAAKAWGLMTPDYLAKIGDLDLDGNPRLTHKGAEPALDLGCYMYTPLGMMLLVR